MYRLYVKIESNFSQDYVLWGSFFILFSQVFYFFSSLNKNVFEKVSSGQTLIKSLKRKKSFAFCFISLYLKCQMKQRKKRAAFLFNISSSSSSFFLSIFEEI